MSCVQLGDNNDSIMNILRTYCEVMPHGMSNFKNRNDVRWRNSKIITDYIDVLHNTTHKKYANMLQIPDDVIPP